MIQYIHKEMEKGHKMAKEETLASLIRRISAVTGFKQVAIVPLEGTLGLDGKYESCEFAVYGKGFWTDFKDWDRAEAYDLVER